MALCLAEIDYDAFVLGNHEFNYEWETMSKAYSWLEEQGVPVLAGNICYDGSDQIHEAGENVFGTYLTKTITVNGNEHKIGILGMENCDITRWDLPVNYPGLMFVHPGNEEFSMAKEINLYLPQMKEEGCEFIVVSYHGGLGDLDEDLAFGLNSESQGLRVLQESEDIDLFVLGHDHYTSYSNTYHPDKNGRDVLVVNGGSKDLTKSVLRFSEDEEGALTWEVLDSQNLNLKDYDADEALQEKIAPYAKMAEEWVNTPLGTVTGDWDHSNQYFSQQTDTMDLISVAQLYKNDAILEKYGEAGPEGTGVEGLDHLDVDMAISSSVTSDNYVVKPGDITVRDIYKLYRYDNNLVVLALTGGQIKEILEENAADHYRARIYRGETFLYSSGDSFTCLITGGLNFIYDLSKPEGERVTIEGFSNGRSFEEDGVYLVSTNNFLLGNERCGLRSYSLDDAVWSQIEDADGALLQQVIIDYIKDTCEEKGSLTPEDFHWHWSVEYSADPQNLPPCPGEKAAIQVLMPEDGHSYLIYHEPDGYAFTGEEADGKIKTAACEAYGDALLAPIPEDAMVFTAHKESEGRFYFTDPQGRYLSMTKGAGFFFTDEEEPDDRSLWELRENIGAWNIINVGSLSDTYAPKALELYGGYFNLYSLVDDGKYLFNFYEPVSE